MVQAMLARRRCHDSPQLRRADCHFAADTPGSSTVKRETNDVRTSQVHSAAARQDAGDRRLIVLLLVPIAQVESLVGERVGMRQTAAARVAESWGGAQTTAGVLLAIPVETTRVVVEQSAAGRETSARKSIATCSTCCPTRST